MARVTLDLPTLLRPAAGGRATLALEAATLRGALDALVAAHPALGQMLLDETGAFRPHVLCFVNDENTRWLEGADRPLADGDRLRILQAVSGG